MSPKGIKAARITPSSTSSERPPAKINWMNYIKEAQLLFQIKWGSINRTPNTGTIQFQTNLRPIIE
jgi:hypothetical protein